MTATAFRVIVLSLEGAIEGAHMGHPDFRVNGRIFASLHPGETKAMVKLALDEQDAFVRAKPDVFAPSSGAWGRQGCTDVLLAKVDRTTMRSAAILAWEAAMQKPPAKRRAPSGARRPARKR